MVVLFKKQLQHGRGSTLCDNTTPISCNVEQEDKFLRGNEGRKASIWWEQSTFSFWSGFMPTLPSAWRYCNNFMNLNAPVGKNTTNQQMFWRTSWLSLCIWQRRERNKILNAAKTGSKPKSFLLIVNNLELFHPSLDAIIWVKNPLSH